MHSAVVRPRSIGRPSVHASAAAFLAVGLALGAAEPGLAQEEERRSASGTFSGREWTFEASGAYAFPAEVGMDDEPGIRVAVSNGGFAADRLDRVWDREYAIDHFVRDDETLVVVFHFAEDGKYRGMTYYFGSGDGCGFCYDGAVQSTVKVEKGRIHGTVTQPPQPDEPSWNIAFDVPVAPADYGKPLQGPDFGEPGKAYAAFHAALAADSVEAMRPLVDAEDAADLDEYGAQVLAALRENHPTESYRIVRGFLDGDDALLLVEGATSYSKAETEVQLQRIDGTWRVLDEILRVKLGE